jgi:hypothetical protein
MNDKGVLAWLWALVGACSAVSALQLAWPESPVFIALGAGAVIMAVRRG